MRKRRIESDLWLRAVREDLDSKADAWIAKTPLEGMSKLETIGSYLDVILTELGYPPTKHKCPECDNVHDMEK